MKGSHTILKAVAVTIILILMVPLLQKKFHFFEETPLKGAVQKVEESYFSFNRWFSGEYQSGEEKYLNDNFGLRNFFVRLNNQLAYTFFNKAKANNVIIGKDNYLFEKNYLKAYTGQDYIGYDSIENRMAKLKEIQDYLERNNKSLLLVFAAGKGTFYPEYFPDDWKAEENRVTNFDKYLTLAKEKGINHIDFNTYFKLNKESSPYPLYPKHGIHWSHYGMCLVVDSLFSYLEKERNIKVADIVWNDVEVSEAKKSDYDIADGMNLLFPPKKEELAYPQYKIISNEGDTKPSVIVISDSFYWGMFNEGIPARAFSDQHFWFYNRQIYPDSYTKPLDVSEIDLSEEINNHEIFIIISTEATLPGLGWGFIENTYDLIKNGKSSDNSFSKKVKELITYIRTDKNWMKSIEQKAKDRNISVDSMLTLDAEWQVKRKMAK
jgi:hypothetical protein